MIIGNEDLDSLVESLNAGNFIVKNGNIEVFLPAQPQKINVKFKFKVEEDDEQ